MKRILIALAVVALAGAIAAVVVPRSSAGTDGLSADEIADLRYMREEEKLARDVYQELASKWSDDAIFARIAHSEQRHMDAVKVVLDRYGISDPAAGKAQGRFYDPRLQKLYDELVADGSRSLVAALAVGVKIEEVDIADLEDALATTSNTDLERLYANLLRGSQNHLRAFTNSADGTRFSQGYGPNGSQGDATCTRDGQRGRGSGAGGGNAFGGRARAACGGC